MYDQLARFYDWEHRDFKEDLPLYLGFARGSAGPILDAACGTGRVLIPLAEAGHTVTGVDRSAGMLEIARAKVAGGHLERRVRLVHSDLRSVELHRRYGMALVAGTSFHDLLTVDDQRQALARLAEHLMPGGLLLIDLVNPSPEWLAAGDGTLVHQLTAPCPDPEGPDMLTKFMARATDFGSQTEKWLLIYDQAASGGVVKRFTFQMESRLLFRYEMQLLLEEAGFRIRDLYGGFDLEAYRSASPHMIFVAEKR